MNVNHISSLNELYSTHRQTTSAVRAPESQTNPLAAPKAGNDLTGANGLDPTRVVKFSHQVELNISSQVSYAERVDIRYSSSRSLVDAKPGVEQYQAVAEAPEAPSAASQNILSFIDAQMSRDKAAGDDSEELQSRLEAGYSGFMQGYSEAATQLQDSGLLTGDVKASVEQVLKDVQAGIEQLAKKYALQSPVESPVASPGESLGESPAASAVASSGAIAPSSSAVVNAGAASGSIGSASTSLNLPSFGGISNVSTLQYAARSFDFQLKTAEGDLVTIQAFSEYQKSLDVQSDEGGYSVGVSKANADSFSFSVKGDLNEEELQAINDLLSQVNDLANEFYQGDIENAFNKAINLGYDSEQITRFSLNLRQDTVTQVQQTYDTVAQYGDQESRDDNGGGLQELLQNAYKEMDHMRGFIEMLEKARQSSEQLGMERTSFMELTSFRASIQESQESRGQSAQFSSITQSFLTALDKVS